MPPGSQALVVLSELEVVALTVWRAPAGRA